MIDPRFANAGAVPGYGGQQLPVQYHHRHHRHHKHKVRNDQSPVSLDESIHKVDHSQPQYFHQHDGAQYSSGYGVPYGSGAYEVQAPYGATAGGGYATGQSGYYSQQQQQYGSGNFGYGNQYQNVGYGQVPYGNAPGAPVSKHHRRHHRHHRHHTNEAGNVQIASEQVQAVPEQLIGQRSSSVLGEEQHEQQQSPVAPAEGTVDGERSTHRRHHHRRHHRHQQPSYQQGYQQSGENVTSTYTQQQQQSSSLTRTTAAADGYGHINDELIFIERGEHSPHRQEPPAGYEYKGKIEVQSYDKETRIQGQTSTGQQATGGPCPPGWTQVVMSGGACGPCPSGAIPYTGQATGGAQTGVTGFGTSASYGATSSYGASTGYGSATGYGSYGAGGGLPPNCQVVADYLFGSNAGRFVSGGSTGYEKYNQQQTGTNVTTRATVIEVWQKRSKHTEIHERPGPTITTGPDFDFEKFRADILAAIERIIVRGRDDGTQTVPRPIIGGETKIIEKVIENQGEVRVIVQPIQPVFYMPRQTGGETTTTHTTVGPIPIAPQPAPAPAAAAPQIVYVPRNVYVPVIKPVFVPRERVIVRPQVIHVARPVLVDRPVPVTQRPIIIDRERPVPVPVRGGQGAAQAGGSKIVQEEFVYRDNLPVAYGGRCAEFAGGVNYGYTPAQQQQQYASSSVQETGSIYQAQGQNFNVNVPTQYQQSQTSSHVEVQQGGAGSFHGSYSNLADAGLAGGNAGQYNQEVFQQTFEQSAQGVGGVGGTTSYQTKIEVLDPAVNPCWQQTDQTSLVRRYGRSAYQIVHQGEEVEQQMYREIRQRASSGGVVRSSSTASYTSTSGVEFGAGGCVDGVAQY